MSTIEIVTDRLILRHPVMEDAETIMRGKQEVWPELQRWMRWSTDGQETLEATQDFIRSPIGRNSLIGFCRHSGEFVVMSGLTPQEAPDEYETGYWVARDYLGKGYATEACNAVTNFGLTELKARTIHICYFSGNEKSRRVIEKLGFSNERICNQKRICPLDGGIQKSHMFTMTDPTALPVMPYEWRGRW
jgi:RimJ/RimL family protein N-acetyltransferase